jgi:hypothetical protein
MSYKVLSKTYTGSWTVAEEYILPMFRSLLSSHPDIASLLLLLIVLYVSLMVLSTASRFMYSMVMTVVRMAVLAAMVLGAVWLVKVGQGQNGTETVSNGLNWAVNKGRQYAFQAAGEFLNR